MVPTWDCPKAIGAVFGLEARVENGRGSRYLRLCEGGPLCLGKNMAANSGRAVSGLVGGSPLCIFRAISQRDRASTVVLYSGSRGTKRKVSFLFTVTPCQSADPDFALEFRLLAHGQLPFGFKSLTVRKDGS